MSCPYITSLDRECGRPATTGAYCDLHSLLAQLDAADWRDDEVVIVVPKTVQPIAARILSDVVANFDAMPTTSREIPRIGWLLGLNTASMNRNEARRQMSIYPGTYGD